MRYAAVPSGHHAAVLADEFRSIASTPLKGSALVDQLHQLGGFTRCEVSFPRSEPVINAMLVPRERGGFTICLSRNLTRSQRAGLNAPLDFLVAHEMAHTFFYDRCARPHRRFVAQSSEEEAFCDSFARHLLLPSMPRSSCIPNTAWLQRLSVDNGINLGTAASGAVVDIEGLAIVMVVVRRSLPTIAWAAGRIPAWMKGWTADVHDGRVPVPGEAASDLIENTPLEGTGRPRLLIVSTKLPAHA